MSKKDLERELEQQESFERSFGYSGGGRDPAQIRSDIERTERSEREAERAASHNEWQQNLFDRIDAEKAAQESSNSNHYESSSTNYSSSNYTSNYSAPSRPYESTEARKKRVTKQMWDSIQHNNHDNLKEALVEGANAKTNEGTDEYSPLHHALIYGRYSMIDTLVQHGASVNNANKDWSPMKFAAIHGHLSLYATLLKHGANIREPGILRLALKNTYGKHKEVCELFMHHGVKLEELHKQAEPPEVKEFLQQKLDLANFFAAPLSLEAAKSKILSAVSNSYDHNSSFRRDKHIDLQTGLKIVEHCLKSMPVDEKIPLDERRSSSSKSTPLYYAVEYGHPDVCKLLLKYGADPLIKNDYNETAMDACNKLKDYIPSNHKPLKLQMLTEAIEKQAPKKAAEEAQRKAAEEKRAQEKARKAAEKKRAEEEAQKKAEEEKDKAQTNIFVAAREGNVEWLQQCLQAGATIHERNPDGYTPLHAAALEGNKEICKLLIEYGADPFAINNANKTPLEDVIKKQKDGKEGLEEVIHFLRKEMKKVVKTKIFEAVAEGNVELLKKCLGFGAPLNTKNEDNLTLLHVAARSGAIDICKELLSHAERRGVDIVNVHGGRKYETPLHCAANKNRIEICELFLDHGADFFARNSNGESALESVEKLRRSNHPLINFLRERMPELSSSSEEISSSDDSSVESEQPAPIIRSNTANRLRNVVREAPAAVEYEPVQRPRTSASNRFRNTVLQNRVNNPNSRYT